MKKLPVRPFAFLLIPSLVANSLGATNFNSPRIQSMVPLALAQLFGENAFALQPSVTEDHVIADAGAGAGYAERRHAGFLRRSFIKMMTVVATFSMASATPSSAATLIPEVPLQDKHPQPVPGFREQMPAQALVIPINSPLADHAKSVPYGMQEESRQAVHLGGIGTGSFEWNLDGQWTSARFAGRSSKDIFPEGQVAIYAKQGGRTVATPLGKHPDPEKDKRLSSWPWARAQAMAAGATFKGLWPFGQWEYPTQEGLPRVTIRRFSPFIPHDEKTSSLPAAITQVEVINTSSEESEVSVMVSVPNMVGWNQQTYKDPYFTLTPQNNGQTSRMVENDQYQGLLMASKRAPDANFAGQMALLAEKQEGDHISWQSAFNAQSDGQAVWGPFETNGQLSNGPAVSSVDNEQAGAVAVKVKLKPGERRVVSFSVAWDFPADVRNGKTFKKYYTNDYGTEGRSAFKIAARALNEQVSWEQRIKAWHDTVLKDPLLSDDLKMVLINEAYYFVASGALFTAEGDLYMPENPDTRLFGTLDVAFYNPELAELFPSLDKKYVKRFVSAISIEDRREVGYMNPAASIDPDTHQDNLALYGMDPVLNAAALNDPKRAFDINGPYKGFRKVRGAVEHDENDRVEGEVTDAAGNPVADRINRYLQNHNLWKDLSPKLVLMAWRSYAMDGQRDKKFLKDVWDNLTLAMAYQKRFDTDGDGLPDHQGFPDWTYDDWKVKGPTTYTAVLTLEALEAMIAMGKAIGIPKKQLKPYQQWLKQGKKSLNKKLWNGQYFNVAEGNTDIMSDALVGVLQAKLYGLPAVVSDGQIRKHMQKVSDNNLHKFADGKIGVLNSMHADGTTKGMNANGIQEGEVWIGVQRGVAALMYLVGMPKQANEIFHIDVQSTWRDGFQFRITESLDGNRNYRFATYLRAGAVGMIRQAIYKMHGLSNSARRAFFSAYLLRRAA